MTPEEVLEFMKEVNKRMDSINKDLDNMIEDIKGINAKLDAVREARKEKTESISLSQYWYATWIGSSM